MRPPWVLVATVAATLLLAGCGNGFGSSQSSSSSGPLKILIGSSGPAETKAVQAAANHWAKKNGRQVQVIPAQNLDQQMGQGFAGGNPPDVFYLDPTKVQQFAKGGSLYAYGSKLPASTVADFYPALVRTYTYKGQLYCAPKDLDTHELVVNTDMAWRWSSTSRCWAAAASSAPSSTSRRSPARSRSASRSFFLFQGSGAVNAVLALFGVHGPKWFTDSRGLIQILLSGAGIVDPAHVPAWLDTNVLSLSLWNWLAGPSVAMVAIITLTVWSTSGTFMLFFLSGLQNIPVDVEEVAAVDGATAWQRFRHVRLPLMRRSVVLMITLSLIGSWQVFDQVYVMFPWCPTRCR